MRPKLGGIIFLGLALTMAVTMSARPGQGTEHNSAARTKANLKKPLKLLGAIYLPGNPLRFDISWVDQATGRYYLGEAGNASVDVFDAENDLFVGPNRRFSWSGFAGRPLRTDARDGPERGRRHFR